MENNPDEKPEYEDQEVFNDPVLLEQMEDRVDDGIKRKLQARFGFAEDELKTLFPTRQSLRDFYMDTIKARKVGEPKRGEVEKKEGKEPVDTYDLPPAQKAEVRAKLDRRAKAKTEMQKRLVQRGQKMLGNVSTEPEIGAEEVFPVSKKEVDPNAEIDTANPPKSLKELLDGQSIDDFLKDLEKPEPPKDSIP